MHAETVQGRPSACPGHSRELADGFDALLAYYDRLHEESRAMIEHEAHHRGQLYLMLGVRGVTTPPMYGLTAQEVQARSVRRDS